MVLLEGFPGDVPADFPNIRADPPRPRAVAAGRARLSASFHLVLRAPLRHHAESGRRSSSPSPSLTVALAQEAEQRHGESGRLQVRSDRTGLPPHTITCGPRRSWRSACGAARPWPSKSRSAPASLEGTSGSGCSMLFQAARGRDGLHGARDVTAPLPEDRQVPDHLRRAAQRVRADDVDGLSRRRELVQQGVRADGEPLARGAESRWTRRPSTPGGRRAR